MNFDRYCLGRGRIGSWISFAFEEQDSDNVSGEIARRLEALSDIPFSDYVYFKDDKVIFLEMSFEDYTYENLVRILKKENVRRLLIRYLVDAVDG